MATLGALSQETPGEKVSIWHTMRNKILGPHYCSWAGTFLRSIDAHFVPHTAQFLTKLTTKGASDTIHGSGAVASSGLAQVPQGSRVHDAVCDRGGLTHEADVERTNLARALTDGKHVHIPRQGETLRPDDTAPTPVPSVATPQIEAPELDDAP
jgi:hypothetical protein